MFNRTTYAPRKHADENVRRVATVLADAADDNGVITMARNYLARHAGTSTVATTGTLRYLEEEGWLTTIVQPNPRTRTSRTVQLHNS